MWPALIRGSVFSSIRSSALLPSDQPSDDIFPSHDGNLNRDVNIENINSSNNNNNGTGDFGYNINMDKGSSTAVADSLDMETSPPARRCEMLSIKELTSNDSSPDSSLSHPPYSSWPTARTSPPSPITNSASPSAPDRYSDTEHTYSNRDQSFMLTASEESHEITDEGEEYNDTHQHQRHHPHRHHQDHDHHPVCNNNLWHDQNLEQATSAATSSIIAKKNASADATQPSSDGGFLSISSLLESKGKGSKTRKKRSISSSSSSASSSSSSSSNANTDKEDDDPSEVSTIVTSTATAGRTTGGAKSSNSKRKAQNMDDRPFACPLCERRFNRRYNLNAHIRIHDPHRKKLFDCPVCTQSFDRKHDRDRHVDALHFENKRRALCHLCDASFTRRDALTRHMHKLHTRPSS